MNYISIKSVKYSIVIKETLENTEMQKEEGKSFSKDSFLMFLNFYSSGFFI